MKKIILSVIALMIATSASANNYDYGTVIKVTEVQHEVTRTVPYESCKIVDVPVYGTTYSEPNIGGAIIGGIIGNQFGNGSGKEAMTALGAVIGSQHGTRSSRIVGYRQERVCNTEYEYVKSYVNDGYKVTYEYNGNKYLVHTTKKYQVGNRIKLKVNPLVVE